MNTHVPAVAAQPSQGNHISASVKASLFAKVTDDICAYAIIDGQWCEDIYGRLLGEENSDWCSLIAGELAHELALTAPYLVRLEQDSDLTNWLIEEGWGKGWGIYFLASKSRAKELYKTPPPESLKQQVERGAFVASPDISEDEATDVVLLRRHFRRYLRVEFESDGRLVRFRFFDPAVLRVWLLSTNPLETQAFFGPITDFIAEDWCEEPSLCHDHQLWYFATPDHGQHCTANRFDMLTRKRTPMTPITESSTQTNERPKSHITLIRKAQEKTFADMQIELRAIQLRTKVKSALDSNGIVFEKEGHSITLDACRYLVANKIDDYELISQFVFLCIALNGRLWEMGDYEDIFARTDLFASDKIKHVIFLLETEWKSKEGG
ncbi:hypothetical protein PsAD2_02596 [Pseudovibrio axinellae]|uniref:DUF4123 domain-containing protein n=1 Tax=Pseudovibrio axinellae TaxID=989403 RepID=A0A165Y3R8_9HYPH|nr:DUF4123 domain-containing protein [Pseudovibrio axinellae]KZL18412.1 hypothetical protein PsAD2_02596 [Pseudovibrio axinellae]SER82681.1 protein of unknown function [Pseudovibrio axinellae]